VAYRAIVALGNLVSMIGQLNRHLTQGRNVPQIASPALSGSLEVGDVEVAKELASGIANVIGEQRLKDIAQQI
jgi:hypothetical protein